MRFKDVLIHMDGSQQCARRLDMTVSLALQHHAHLTGIYIITHAPHASQLSRVEADLAKAERMFLQKTAEANIPATWLPVDWPTVGTGMAEVLNYHGYAKDLVIIGQAGSMIEANLLPADLPGQVVAGAGRPVLIVPFAGSYNAVGDRVVVAWKSGRASARALNDGMPFLLNAREVFLLSITTPGERVQAEPENSIATNLQRHGIKVAEAKLVADSIPVAKLVMDFAWENACDLVVMGVNARQRDLGPVARVFFDNMTLPVLMSC